MPRLKNAEDLLALSESLKQSIRERAAEETTITVGVGTCGLAAGAGETLQAIRNELAKREAQVIVRTVGCIGMCVKEPLVDIQLPNEARVTYTNVTPAQVPRLIDEHVLNGRPVLEWAIGTVPADW
jgi:NADP-reducing hydrogenase subunit HndB